MNTGGSRGAVAVLVAATFVVVLAGCGSAQPNGAPDAGPDAGHAADSGVGSDAGEDAGAPVPCDGGATVTAKATYYETTAEVGACSLPLTTSHYAAASPALWNGSGVCGTCADVTGPKGTTRVLIADQCPECTGPDLDLSATAFAEIAEPTSGIADVSWTPVPCEVTGNVQYAISSGANPYWLALTVLNHRHPIASLELQPSGANAYAAMQRETYNAFVYSPGVEIALPAKLRLTDLHGHVLIDTLETIAAGSTVTGAGQFEELCGP